MTQNPFDALGGGGFDLNALMQQAHVAVTPGRDFGSAETHKYIRFSTASALPQLQAAVERLRQLLK